jgi:peptidoglycan/xylan/chitin deacetylase (PgdA/CDA1 family)
MEASTVLKVSLDTLHFSGATSIFRKQFQGIGAVFCLHQVFPGGGVKTTYSPNYQLELSPDFLQETIDLCLKRGYELVSLSDAAKLIKSGTTPAKPFAVFTLDDGYRDNAEHAAPVFQRNNCPYTIFVTPRIAEGTCELWWRILELVIKRTKHLKVSNDGVAMFFDTSTDELKSAAWSQLAPMVKSMPEYAQRDWIRALAQEQGFDWQAYCRDVAMTWEEIRELNRDPLCTIGAHTLNHYAIKRLSTEDALQELAQSKSAIETRLGELCEFFAYPYGDEAAAGPRDFDIASKAGFTASVTTRKSVVYPEYSNHLQAIPRIMLSGRYQKSRYVDALLSGLPLALLNRLRRVNVG